jgi:hypothetical protein
MNTLLKIIVALLLPFIFISCSVIFGGLTYLDNSLYKGEKEIEFDKIIQLHKGHKLIVELTDSTEIRGVYNGYENKNEKSKIIINIFIIDENKELHVINTSEVRKYIYVDEGGNVWTAIAIGAAIDSLIIYAGISSGHSGFGGKIF